MYNGYHFYEGLHKEHGLVHAVVKARSKRSADKILLNKYNKGWYALGYCNFKELNTVEETELIKIIESLDKHKELNTRYVYLKQE